MEVLSGAAAGARQWSRASKHRGNKKGRAISGPALSIDASLKRRLRNYFLAGAGVAPAGGAPAAAGIFDASATLVIQL